MITPSKQKPKLANAEAFGRAVAQFQGELNELIASGENGSVSLTLHVNAGQIQKPKIERTRYPT